MNPSARIAHESEQLSRSLWTATARTLPATPPLEGEVRADVAVIGAGFTGLSAAIHLAERGVSVVVLEAETPGWGASGRNGGQVIPGLKEDPDDIERLYGGERGESLVRFSGAAPDVVFDLIARFGIDCAPVRSGWIQPAHDGRSQAELERRVEQWARRGAPIAMLDRDETTRLIGSECYIAGGLDRRGGAVHPLNYAIGLAEAAVGQGVRLHGGSPALSMARQTDGWRVTAPRGSVRADQVLVCTNAYSGDLHEGLRRSIVPVCSIQVASEPLSANVRATIFPEGHVSSDMRRLLFYFRLSPEGRLVMGGRGAYTQAGVAAQMQRLRRIAADIFPQTGALSWDHHWGGYVAMTADHFPHLNELEPGLTAALGYNGRGVAMASAMGKVLADKVTGTPANQLDFPQTPLRTIPFHRFRKAGVGLLVAWKGWRDRLDAQKPAQRATTGLNSG